MKLVPKHLHTTAIRIATGGPTETARIFGDGFNHMFFTGSNKVARYMTAVAAKHLTRMVLKLGGQGPAIATASADVDLNVTKIALGKFHNAGQICLSTSHVLVDPSIHDKVVERLDTWFGHFSETREWLE